MISAAEILAKYNVLKSVKYIRDIKVIYNEVMLLFCKIQDNVTEVEQLLRRLVRGASRK